MFTRLKNSNKYAVQKQQYELSPSQINKIMLSVTPQNNSWSKTQPINPQIHKESSSERKHPFGSKNKKQDSNQNSKSKFIVLENQDVIKIIQESQNLLKNNQLIQGINLLKALKDTSIKVQSNDLKLIILLNLAVAYYQTGFLQQAFEDFVLLSENLSSLAQSAFSAGKFIRKLKYLTLQGKVQLQICILFSEMGKHDQALKNARKSCKINFELVYDVLNSLCRDFLKGGKTTERESSKESDNLAQENLINNILLLQHMHKLIGDLNQIFHVPDKIKVSKQLLSQVHKLLPKQRSLKVDMQLLFHSPDQASVTQKSQSQDWIFSSKILDQIKLKSLSPNFFSNQREIKNAQIVEKITYLAISFYCYSTEIRFIEKNQTGIDQDEVMDSEHWLSRSLEVAYSFMPPTAPILNQILTVHDRFHGIDKQTIPQDKQVRGYFKVLKPLSKPKSVYSSKSHMCSPIMIRIQAPKITVDIQQPWTVQKPAKNKSMGKVSQYSIQQSNRIFDIESLTKNNKIKGLQTGFKILQFSEMNHDSHRSIKRNHQDNIKITSRSTISDLSPFQAQKQKKKRISKIYSVTNTMKPDHGNKYVDFRQQRKKNQTLSELDHKAIISEDLLHRPHSYEKNINRWEQAQTTSKGYTTHTQKRRTSLTSRTKDKLEKIVYNGPVKFDGLKLTGKKLSQNFQIDSSFLVKLNQAHKNQQTIIENAKKLGGNIFINNNINLYISKPQEYPKTSRQLSTQSKEQTARRQKLIGNKRGLSHLNVYPSSLQQFSV